MRSLGWVIWGNDEPHRPDHGSGWRKRKAPPRIYPTEGRACAYAGDDQSAREVFVNTGSPLVEHLLTGQPVTVRYKNWRGVTDVRTILVSRLWRGKTDFHPDEQILVTATDLDRGVEREFALKDMVLA